MNGLSAAGWPRRLAIVMATSLACAALVAARPAGTMSEAAGAPPEEKAALVSARASNAPVELPSQRTDRSRTLVNPDGTRTLEQYAEPVRVRLPSGAWAEPDTTLRRQGNAVRPAAAADVRFSAGGDGPFAVFATEEGTFALSWPGTLPAPVLRGDTAVYRDVRPGVDLEARATAGGFAHVLVVKDREAAADPALRAIRFGVSGDLVPRAAGGGIEASRPVGPVALSAGEPLMWDSGRSGEHARTTRPGEDAGSTSVQPGEGARRARLGLAVSPAALELKPDEDLLNGPGTVYPVYIDPSYAKGNKRWGFANSANENNDNSAARVGRSPDSGALYRSSFAFDVSGIRGKHVIRATFGITLTHSWSCGATPVNLYRGTGQAAGRAAWPGSALSKWLDQRSGHAHKGSGSCSGDPQPDMPMEFGNGLTADVQAGATANWTEYTLVLSARQSDGTDEGVESWWKKFAPGSSRLVVVYNSRPGVPTGLSTDGRGCASGTGRPVLSTATPTLRGVVADADTAETDLRASFAWERLTSGTWSALGSGTQSSLRPGATGQVRIGSGLVSGGVYRWRAQTLDPWSYSGSSGTDASAWSGYCEFEVDTAGPQLEPKVTSPVYGDDLDQFYGSVGLTAPFTLAVADPAKDPDVTGYRWGWEDPPTTAVTAPAVGAPVTLQLTPPPPKQDDPTSGGQITLYAVAVDRAGHLGPLAAYTFNVGSATAPAGSWRLDEPAGATTLADRNERGDLHDAAPSAVVTGVPGRLLDGPAATAPTAARFDGAGSYAITRTPVLNTAKSFSVAAWVRLADAAPTFQTAVSQEGAHTSPFFLQKNGSRWTFATHRTDTAPATTDKVISTAVVVPNVWTHLLGVYDAQSGLIHLYVNGVHNGSTARPQPWNATGPLAIGRALAADVRQNYWSGEISDVRVWDRVVAAAEAAPMAATPVGRWSLDGDGSDGGPYGRDATATPATTWDADHRQETDPGAALLNGSGWLVTGGPAIRTDQSYSVAAWVRLDQAVTWNVNAVGQDGAKVSGFYLGYSGKSPPRWRLAVKTADSFEGAPDQGSWQTAGAAALPEDVGEWVHLVGVHDATTGELRLYVNAVDGVADAVAPVRMYWNAAGPLTLGRGLYAGTDGVANISDRWNGALDDVRVYAGILSPAQIARLAEP
ncbi:LamG domain-containing protein [Nonomuraea sp. NPDC050643]|uniref:LamG domain-containing protein n=1 Tax=Nonomuraea sp. NPDC050643 TaxID=3155660 RepID=UPI0033D18FD7